MTTKKTMVFGIDPGNDICGVCSLLDGEIHMAFEEPTGSLFSRIVKESKYFDGEITVVIEDIVPYYGMKLSPALIDTIKAIGVLTYQLNEWKRAAVVSLIPRATVKKAVFDGLNQSILDKIIARMEYLHKRAVDKGGKGLKTASGEMRKPSFMYVNDRIVIAAMKEWYNIPNPKPGKSNKYGLKSHSWQALAVAACWMRQNSPKSENLP